MRPQTLVIIDAETLLGELIQLTFDPAQVDVVLASSAERGLHLVEARSPDMVLIDPAIPDGARLLEQLSVRLARRQIIVLTSSELMHHMGDKFGVQVLDKGGRLSDLVYTLQQRLAVDGLRRRTGEQVLVVDDDADLRETVMRFLDSCGYGVVGASNGWEALSAVETDELIAVVLLDVSMPEMGGIATLREMKKGKRHPTPIMLSAVSDEEIARQAMDLGAFDYILKPPDLDRVEAAVSTCFSRLQYRHERFWKRAF